MTLSVHNPIAKKYKLTNIPVAVRTVRQLMVIYDVFGSVEIFQVA